MQRLHYDTWSNTVRYKFEIGRYTVANVKYKTQRQRQRLKLQDSKSHYDIVPLYVTNEQLCTSCNCAI